MMQQSKGDTPKRSKVISQVIEVEQVCRKESALVKLGATQKLLQGADGRYSDNDQLRSYTK